MLGLFGTLNLGTRSLQTQQAGVEVTGQNLANVNNPAYSRQRLQIQTTDALPSSLGPVGTGAQAVAIEQLRNALLDTQIRNEQSVGGYWTAQQSGLQNAQISLGEFLDRSASSVDGTTATGSEGTMGLSDALNSFFNDFQSVAASPTSITERQALISQAQTLASRLHEISHSLNDVQTTIQGSIKDDVNSANTLLGDIARLNDLIATTESATTGKANDLRDLREQKLEALARLTNIETATADDGSVNISINGTPLVTGNKQVDSLETYAGSRGQLYVRTANSQTDLTLTGGSLGGSINLQDNEIYSLQSSLDTLAGAVISQVNAIHSTGYDLAGNTGNDFFTGTNASDIAVNSAFLTDASLVQASGDPAGPGDNSVALALSRLKDQPVAALGNQTFSAYYGSIVGTFGQSISGANTQVANHGAVSTALVNQRDSISGVSIDEEMTNLLSYQKAYQASAKIVTTIDEMLDTVLNLKR